MRLVERVSDAETELSEHRERIEALEQGMQEIAESQEKTLKATQATQAAVTAMVPEVLELRAQSRTAKVVKRTGGASLLLVLGAILQDYGPDILRLVFNR
jgi:predicted  nucleic acid-binding Zn-ribbon protein